MTQERHALRLSTRTLLSDCLYPHCQCTCNLALPRRLGILRVPFDLDLSDSQAHRGSRGRPCRRRAPWACQALPASPAAPACSGSRPTTLLAPTAALTRTPAARHDRMSAASPLPVTALTRTSCLLVGLRFYYSEGELLTGISGLRLAPTKGVCKPTGPIGAMLACARPA
eukprot:1504439-Rhodomonas_salina.1